MNVNTYTCQDCSKQFTSEASHAKRCAECRKVAKRARERTSGPAMQPRECARCGEVFQPYKGDQQYCGKDCSYAVHLERTNKPGVPTTRRCRNRDCIERFVPVNPSHWYHEPACGQVDPDRLWSIEQILAEEGALLPGGNHLEMAKAAFGQKNQALRENTRLRSLRDYLTYELRSFYDEYPEYRLPKIAPPTNLLPRSKNRDVEVLVQCSDWQVGKWEDGFGVEATKKRIEQFKSAVASIVKRQQDAGYKVKRIVITLGGDLIENCLPAGTPIFTEDGPVPIENVRVGQRVWAQSDTGLNLRTVTASEMTGIKPVLTIHTAERDIQLTDNHPVLVRRLQRSVTGKGRRATGFAHEWVQAGDLRPGDVLVGLDKLPELDDREEASVEMMEFLGFYIGDGCLSRDRNGDPNGIVLAHEQDAPYMEHYRNIAESLFAHVDGSSLEARVRGNGLMTSINSRSAAETIERLGLDGGALTKRVPGWVFSASREQRLAFLRGYLDSDGHVNKLGQIIYGSAQSELLEDVRHLCMSVGLVVGRVRYQDRMVTPPNGKERLHRLYTLNCGAPDLNIAVGSYTPEYIKRWAAVSGKRRERVYATRQRNKGPREAITATPPPDCRYFRVVSIENGEVVQPVYNITVEVDENYIANGIVLHNCWMYGGQQVSGLDRTSNTHRVTVQVRVVAHLIAEFAAFCATLVNDVTVESVPGNHGRPNAKSEYADPEDNWDTLAAWWASDLTTLTPRIKWNVHEDWWGGFETMGHYAVMFHGDQWRGPFDKLDTLLPNWITNGVFGGKPRLVLTHHRHNLDAKEIVGVKVFQNGTIDGGSKWYTRAYGKSSTPAQRVLVVSEKHAPESVWDVDF